MNPSDQYEYASDVNLGSRILLDDLGRRLFLRIEEQELCDAMLLDNVAGTEQITILDIARHSPYTLILASQGGTRRVYPS